MKKICTVVLMVALLSIGNPAFALIQAFRLGAVGTDTLSGTMYAVSYISSSTDWETLESPVGTDYQVTAGYTLYITKIVWSSNTAGAQVTEIGYADNGVAEGSNALTNKVVVFPVLFGTASATQSLEGLWTIPAGKYPFFTAGVAGVLVMIFGVEVAD